ncbi:MAG: nucleotidyltransferase family protein [Euryarchaeota archaeon]|nr:nucleotidyltransferase family protein [Euryarchaeota archaeon]
MKRTLKEIKEVLALHHAELQDRFHVRKIGIFGSYTRSDQTPLSDVDILVELDRPVGWEIVDLHRYLEELLGVKVDIVTRGAVERKPLLWQSIQEDLVYV